MWAQLAGADAAAGFTIIYRVGTLMISFSQGIMLSTSILVGKSVGEENKPRALKYFRGATYASCSLTALTILVVVLFQDQTFGIFTQQEGVLKSIQDLIPVYFLTLAICSFTNVVYGMIKGMGKQAIASQITLLAYAIGLPISYSAAFHFDLGIVGLQLGVAVSTTLTAIGYTLIILLINWTDLFQEVRERREMMNSQKNAGNHLDFDSK